MDSDLADLLAFGTSPRLYYLQILLSYASHSFSLCTAETVLTRETHIVVEQR
jgi:hypothetical protein